MANFDKKEHLKSPEGYRKLSQEMVLGSNIIFETAGTVLNLELPTKANLLLLGGGGGKELSYFHPFSDTWKFTVLDPSQKMLDFARYWANKEGIKDRTTLLHGYLEDFEFAQASFDAVTCIAVFHYLDVRQRLSILQGIRQMLKPNGVFILTVAVKPDTEEAFEYYKKMLLQFPVQNGVDPKMGKKIVQALETEYKMITAQDEKTMLEAIGFSNPIEVCSTMFFKTYLLKNIKNQESIR